MGVKEEKIALRRRLAALRDAMAGQTRQLHSQKICSLVSSLAVFRFCEVVLLYHPIRSEVDVSPLFSQAFSDGKEVYLPLCDKKEAGVMRFYRITSEAQLTRGSFGVMEPDGTTKEYQNDGKRAVCIVPGLAYDEEGYRLGYGKGYYDRFMQHFEGTSIGVSYSDLILKKVPHNRFDMRSDLVVTEKGVSVYNEI